MTLRDCYEAMGADYDGVMGRLRSERMVQKFALKFLADPSYELLTSSMAAENYEEAFRAAHTIKGVCQNLGFTALMSSSSRLTEALRSGVTPEAPALAKEVAADYERTAAALKELQASVG